MDRRIPTQARRDPLWFIFRLSSAFYELILIILLFAHGLLSYLVYSFAYYCQLQIPCMLCTRINRKGRFFDKELICDVHKLEVSSLAYCHTHRSLAFAHDMCDDCIRLYLDRFVKDLDEERLGDDMTNAPLLKEDSESKGCSCCSIQYRSRPLTRKLLRKEQTDEVSNDSIVPKATGKGLQPLAVINAGDMLSHVGYNEVKLTSDTESEILFSEEEDRKSSISRGITDVKEELLSRCIQGSISKNLNELDTNRKLFSNSQVDESQLTTSIGHGLEEINWNQIEVKPKISISSEVAADLVPVENPSTKLDDAADNSNFTSNGENEVDKLKREIEMDRKSMANLYKELEEERNASAIAANQAMAMINRLQEEKASMQMEASQYLRMMEEQTEYDQEALQKLNDLLADKDEEIQDLEAVVDGYRIQSGEEEPLQPFDSGEAYTPVSTPRFVRPRGGDVGKALVRNTVLDFEDEKIHISECLGKIERKVKSMSSANDSSFNTIPLSIKQAFKESKLRSISYNDRQGLMGGKSDNASDLSNEIMELRKKLEGLEEDRSFLEHAVNSLRNGSSGIQFVQEIACHLRELRNLG